MSVYSINNPLSNGYGINVQSLRKKLEEEEKKNPTLLDSLAPNKQVVGDAEEASEDEKTLLDKISTAAANCDNLAEMVEKLAEELGIEGKITYNKLLDHKEELENAFQEKVKNGLAELGVDPEADFRISLNDDGTIKVSSNHKDKAKIEQFFSENPGLATSYQQIQTLNQVEEARKMGGKNIDDNYERPNLLSYMNKMGTNAALAMNGQGSLASLLNTGFNLTV